jgi:hypothetical protein
MRAAVLSALMGKPPVTEVVLLAGQSNMSGRGVYDAAIDTTSPNIKQFGSRPSLGNYRTTFAGSDPLAHNDAETAVGPGMAFARRRIALRPGTTVILVPCAVGGTYLVAGAAQWKSDGSGSLFNSAFNQANLALAANPGSVFAGVLWLQGEYDAIDGTVTQAAYYDACSAMIAQFRAQITGASNSWFAMGRMVPEFITNYGAASAGINAAHTQIAANVSKAVIADTIATGNAPDNLHYNAAAARAIGTSMADKVQALA